MVTHLTFQLPHVISHVACLRHVMHIRLPCEIPCINWVVCSTYARTSPSCNYCQSPLTLLSNTSWAFTYVYEIIILWHLTSALRFIYLRKVMVHTSPPSRLDHSNAISTFVKQLATLQLLREKKCVHKCTSACSWVNCCNGLKAKFLKLWNCS